MNPSPLLTAVVAAIGALEAVPRSPESLGSLSDSDLLELLRLASRERQLADTHAALIAGEIDKRSAPALGSEGMARRLGLRTAEEVVRVTNRSTCARRRRGGARWPHRRRRDRPLGPYTTDGPVDSGEQYAVIDPTLDDSQMEPVFGFAVTPESVSFSWAPVENAVIYRVSKDGQLVESTDELEVQYDGLEAGVTHTFQIDAVDSEGTIVNARTVPVLAATEADAGVAARTLQPYNLALTYKTFIPDARVDLGFFETIGCGFAGVSGVQFGGDNRSWSPPTAAAPSEPANWRTMMFTNINWQNPPEYSVIYRTNIGTTHVYTNGVLTDQRTATGSITPSDAYRSGSYAQIHFAHSVGNPFCAAGAIRYNATFRFYQSGTIEVAGSRYPVPNHEIYGRWNPYGTETWYPMMQAVNEGFGCLTGYCTNPGIAISVTR